MPTFSSRSTQKLSTCHEDLQRLMKEVVKTLDITILCGHRDEAAQNAAYEAGKSKAKWGQSEHNSMPSMAVDIARWHKDKPHIHWNDWQDWEDMSVIVKKKAAELGIKVYWGGDFRSFKDGPHWYLKVEDYE